MISEVSNVVALHAGTSTVGGNHHFVPGFAVRAASFRSPPPSSGGYAVLLLLAAGG
jgi:hypothetical protein